MPDPTPNPNPQGNPVIDPAAAGNPVVPEAVDWSKHIPTEFAKEKVWEPLKGKPLGDVLKGYVEAQKFIGGSIKIPGKDAKPEEWDKFYGKLGRPEAADKYTPVMPDLPEGFSWDEGQMKSFFTAAHKAGLTTAQTQTLVDWYAEDQKGVLKAGDEAIKVAEETLKGEWKAAYPRNLGLAKAAAKEIGGKELVDLLDQTGLGNHPVILKAFAKLGKSLAEDGVISGEIEGVMGAADVQKAITAILSDRKHPYFDRNAPGHDAAVEEMARLHQLANPTI